MTSGNEAHTAPPEMWRSGPEGEIPGDLTQLTAKVLIQRILLTEEESH